MPSNPVPEEARDYHCRDCGGSITILEGRMLVNHQRHCQFFWTLVDRHPDLMNVE
jgi:hypothetical protein